MAARKSPSKGGKPDKLMRDALLLELNQEAKLADGKVTKRRRVVARKLVERAEQGDVPAIKEIFDRVDGRVPQAQHLSGPEDAPINVFHRLLQEIDGQSRGLPDHLKAIHEAPPAVPAPSAAPVATASSPEPKPQPAPHRPTSLIPRSRASFRA
jgi:Family of unknown function (DUF5681)